VADRPGKNFLVARLAAVSRSTVTSIYFAGERDIGNPTSAAYRGCSLGYARFDDSVINKDLDNITDAGQCALKRFHNRSLIAKRARKSEPNVQYLFHLSITSICPLHQSGRSSEIRNARTASLEVIIVGTPNEQVVWLF